MEFAVYQHDIKHIILDNLQFLMPRKQGRPYDKFDSQDLAIEVPLPPHLLPSSLSLSLFSSHSHFENLLLKKWCLDPRPSLSLISVSCSAGQCHSRGASKKRRRSGGSEHLLSLRVCQSDSRGRSCDDPPGVSPSRCSLSHSLSLQRIEGGSFVDIRKNRYDGQLGKVAVDFNQMTRCFFESDRELEAESTTAPANRFKKS
jgi:hypothetical protein